MSKLKTDYIALSEVADVRFSSVDKHTVATERPVRLCNYTDVFKNRFISNSMGFMTASATDSEIERFGLRHGDIAITKDSETPDEIGIPALIEQPASDLVLGYHLALIRAKAERCDPYFLSAALQTRHVARHYLRTAVGLTRFGLSIKAVADTPVPSLPLASQRRIGRWYREAARMESHTDALIAAKREQKRGLMQQLLTGKVRFPGFTEPWKTVRLGDVLAIDPEQLPAATPPDYTFKYIDLGSVNDGVVEVPTQPIDFATAPSRARRVLRQGDVLLSTVRPLLRGFGMIEAIDGPLVGSTGFAVLRASRAEDARFCLESLFSENVLRQMHARTTGSSYPALGSDDVRSLVLPWPSQSERNRIGAVLTAATKEIRTLAEAREALATQRRGLMERLLSGEIDIPSSDTPAA